MEYINCILCNRNDSEHVLTCRDFRYNTSRETFAVVKCKKCGLLYVNPRPSKDEIHRYYPDNYRTRNTLKSDVKIETNINKKYKTRIKGLFLKNPWYLDLSAGTKVLDIGCGAGELLLRLNELGCNAYGIDIDEIVIKTLRETTKLNVIQCDIDNGTLFTDNLFDVIIMQHSLEHVYNPLNVLLEVSRIIKPKGILIIGVPNIDSYVSKITKEDWDDLDVPRHLFHFNPSTISALLNKAGFFIENIEHEFKVSRPSLKRWMAKIPLPSIFIPKPLTDLIGIASCLFHRSERIVVKARKISKEREKQGQKHMTPVSVCCLTFNSERTIKKTLESVKKIADEIIVVDSFSTDRTIEIVKGFTDKIFFKEYKYHGLQMNYAIGLCTYDWVFCIDSDECLDDDMIRHVQSLKEEGLDGKEAFRLRREWFFLGKPVHAFYPVTSPDRIVRFFNRKYVRFNEKPVHDKPTGHKKCYWLEGSLLHDSTASLYDLYDKLNKYTTRYAEGNASKAETVGLRSLLLNPFAAFIKWYFLKKNILDGTRGFILGMYAAMYTFFKYAKLYFIKINKNLL